MEVIHRVRHLERVHHPFRGKLPDVDSTVRTSRDQLLARIAYRHQGLHHGRVLDRQLLCRRSGCVLRYRPQMYSVVVSACDEHPRLRQRAYRADTGSPRLFRALSRPVE